MMDWGAKVWLSIMEVIRLLIFREYWKQIVHLISLADDNVYRVVVEYENGITAIQA